jgi:hypothetical protein
MRREQKRVNRKEHDGGISMTSPYAVIFIIVLFAVFFFLALDDVEITLTGAVVGLEEDIQLERMVCVKKAVVVADDASAQLEDGLQEEDVVAEECVVDNVVKVESPLAENVAGRASGFSLREIFNDYSTFWIVGVLALVILIAGILIYRWTKHWHSN